MHYIEKFTLIQNMYTTIHDTQPKTSYLCFCFEGHSRSYSDKSIKKLTNLHQTYRLHSYQRTASKYSSVYS